MSNVPFLAENYRSNQRKHFCQVFNLHKNLRLNAIKSTYSSLWTKFTYIRTILHQLCLFFNVSSNIFSRNTVHLRNKEIQDQENKFWGHTYYISTIVYTYLELKYLLFIELSVIFSLFCNVQIGSRLQKFKTKM